MKTLRAARSAAFVLAFTPAGGLAAPAHTVTPHGVAVEDMDFSVKPGDDFFEYTNGAWIKRTPIPADQGRWGSFSSLRDAAAKRTAGLIQDAAKRRPAPGSEEQKVGDYYASFMDVQAIAKAGTAPLKPELQRIGAIRTKTDLARALGQTLRGDVDPMNNTNFFTENLFGMWAGPAFSDPSRYTAYLLQGGIGLPDREYYLAQDAKMKDARKAYQAHIVKILSLAGIADPAGKAARIMALETRIAQAHETRAESEDVLKANNIWTPADFAKRAPGLDWTSYFAAAGLSRQPSFDVWHPKAFIGVSALVKSQPLDDWKAWLAFHAINRAAFLLPKAFEDENFAFYGKELSGTPKKRDRWKRAVEATNGALGWAVGKLYAARYFTPEAKAAAQAMVENIKTAFAARIDSLSWMSAATKAKAKAKVGTLYVGIGYPDKWQSYAGLEIRRGDTFGNWKRAEMFEYRRELHLLGTKVDPTEWCMTPQTVNAVNLPLQNALNFPAAIMEKPFFDAKAPMVVNYGAIGSVIGHEISHSFDDQGSQFDEHGKLHNWWTKDDLAHFHAASEKLVAQYNAYAPFPDLRLNGRLTLGENIADVAGLAAAFDGWRASMRGKMPIMVQGFTSEQAFFIGYAQTRQDKPRDATLRKQVLTDGHSPSRYRAYEVRNIDAWYDAFAVKPGEMLYLAPKDRVQVW